MKTLITPNLIRFALTAVILTVLFRLALSTSITNKMTIYVILSSLTYGVLMWFNGRYFGRKEYENIPIYDVGFRFHLSTFIAHNLVSILWFVFGFESHYENIKIVYLIAAIWSLFLIIHFFYFLSSRKESIKNLDKEDLFE
jgi:hypothetical protein